MGSERKQQIRDEQTRSVLPGGSKILAVFAVDEQKEDE